jgi:hypothetical protein
MMVPVPALGWSDTGKHPKIIRIISPESDEEET